MREVRTEIVVDAPVSAVFEILVDTDRYRHWNPLIVDVRGKALPGERLDIVIRMPGKPDLPYAVEVLAVTPNHSFVWIGRMKMTGVLDGKHFFEVSPEGPNRTRVVQREEFRGLLVPFVWRSFLDTRMREGFEAVNRSLKRVAAAPR